MPEIKVEDLLHTSDDLPRLAHLHKQGLSDTITSNRGVHTLERIYRRLARSGHTVYRAAADGRTVGGLVVLRNALNRQSLFIVFANPFSWIRTIRTLGLKDFLRQLVDLVAVK